MCDDETKGNKDGWEHHFSSWCHYSKGAIRGDQTWFSTLVICAQVCNHQGENGWLSILKVLGFGLKQ